MGGRGASSGISVKGKVYGTEYHTVLKSGNIKFVKINEGNTKSPLETMTKGRVYVTVNDRDQLKHITYFDNNNKRKKTIDLDKPHDGVSPHTHHGYNHNENDSIKGYANLTIAEKKMVDRVYQLWKNRKRKK